MRPLRRVTSTADEVAAPSLYRDNYAVTLWVPLRAPPAAGLGHAGLTRLGSTALSENTEYAWARNEFEPKRVNNGDGVCLYQSRRIVRSRSRPNQILAEPLSASSQSQHRRRCPSAAKQTLHSHLIL
jgi:hypothetical protein